MKTDYLEILSSIKKYIKTYNKLENNDISLVIVTKSQSKENISKVINVGFKS